MCHAYVQVLCAMAYTAIQLPLPGSSWTCLAQERLNLSGCQANDVGLMIWGRVEARRASGQRTEWS